MMELEAGVLQEALNVPDEIWVLVATHLTIHGIKALESVSCFSHRRGRRAVSFIARHAAISSPCFRHPFYFGVMS